MRRTLALLAAALLSPGALAAHSLEGARVLEQPLAPGGAAAFEVPFSSASDGHAYAKILPTSGNAVHDGARANGSAQDGTGWRVAFALRRDSGATEDLGAFSDSTPTRAFPLRAGERATLLATVHMPPDAGDGGARQTVHLALAWRPGAQAAGPGATSGASMDESLAVTLVLSGGIPAPPPVEDDPDDGPTDVPPVTEIPTDPQGEPQPVATAEVPAWMGVAVLAALAVAVAALAVASAALALVLRETRRARAQPARQARLVPVADAAPLETEPRARP